VLAEQHSSQGTAAACARRRRQSRANLAAAAATLLYGILLWRASSPGAVGADAEYPRLGLLPLAWTSGILWGTAGLTVGALLATCVPASGTAGAALRWCAIGAMLLASVDAGPPPLPAEGSDPARFIHDYHIWLFALLLLVHNLVRWRATRDHLKERPEAPEDEQVPPVEQGDTNPGDISDS
jgi:drug/metabolite transporter (DMT)-like permease